MARPLTPPPLSSRATNFFLRLPLPHNVFYPPSPIIYVWLKLFIYLFRLVYTRRGNRQDLPNSLGPTDQQGRLLQAPGSRSSWLRVFWSGPYQEDEHPDSKSRLNRSFLSISINHKVMLENSKFPEFKLPSGTFKFTAIFL